MDFSCSRANTESQRSESVGAGPRVNSSERGCNLQLQSAERQDLGLPSNVAEWVCQGYVTAVANSLHLGDMQVFMQMADTTNYMVRGACAPLMDSECHSMKTLVNAIDYACRLREGPGNKNISLGSVLKLLFFRTLRLFLLHSW